MMLTFCGWRNRLCSSSRITAVDGRRIAEEWFKEEIYHLHAPELSQLVRYERHCLIHAEKITSQSANTGLR